MAKKSAAKKPAKKAAPKKTAPRKAKAVAAAPAAKSAVDDGQIGNAAGAVWGLLHDGGPQTIAAIKKAADAPSEVTLMAIGWLAREGKLDFVTSGRSLKVALR